MPTRSAMKTVYHVNDGPKSMYIIDANSAVSRHPKEWSLTPWGKKGEKTVQIVEIPDGWEDIKPSERISLAVALGAKRIGLTGAKADEVIATEVERRKAAAEREQEAEEPKPEFEPES